EASAGLETLQRVFENAVLCVREACEVGFLEPPLDFGVAGQRTCSRTGSVQEDAIEDGSKRKWLGSVNQHALRGRVDGFESRGVAVAGDGAGSCGEDLCGLVAGGGANIEHEHAGLRVE